MCDKLVSKYALHTTLSGKDTDEWISTLEGLRIQMNEFGIKGKITDEDFMIHILNNFPQEYHVILDWLKNYLTASRDDVSILQVIWEKLNHGYKK